MTAAELRHAHIGVSIKDQVLVIRTLAFDGFTVHADGDSWDEWGGVDGNVSRGVDTSRRHIVVEIHDDDELARLRDAIKHWPEGYLLPLEASGDTFVLTTSDQWSVPLLALPTDSGAVTS